jgi:hypothetical protein
MEAETLKALEESIKHHKENLKHAKKEDYSQIELGASQCALCKMFGIFVLGLCSNCPVYEKTRVTCCKQTPYQDLVEAYDLKEWEDFIQFEKQEIHFLKSLLPKE